MNGDVHTCRVENVASEYKHMNWVTHWTVQRQVEPDTVWIIHLYDATQHKETYNTVNT